MPQSKGYCKLRNELADNLVELAIKFSIAAVHMAEAAGESANPSFVKAKLAAERLRDECESIQAELSQHRLQHGC